MPLQSLAQRTATDSLTGAGDLLKLDRPNLPATSQPRPKSKRVLAGASVGAGRLAFPAPPSALLDWNRTGSLLFLRDTHRFARSFPLHSTRRPCGASWTPLMGFIKDRPSASMNVARPLPDEPKSILRPEAATPRTRSALAVPPGSDGLLRSTPCRFVAPCNQPWGPSCLGAGFRSEDLDHSPSPRRKTLRSVPLSSSLLRVTSVSRVHRRFVPSRRCSWFLAARSPCCHGLFAPPPLSLDLRALLHRRVRCKKPTLPPSSARCSHGL